MKEAWEIYAAFESARVSTAESLVEDEQWSRSGATLLVEEFNKTSLDWLEHLPKMGLVGLRVRIRYRYEDWLRQ